MLQWIDQLTGGHLSASTSMYNVKTEGHKGKLELGMNLFFFQQFFYFSQK